MPANPEKQHPSMLLHSLRPDTTYEREDLPDKKVRLTAIIDDKTFTGEGKHYSFTIN